MTDIILQIVMIVGGMVAGYGFRAIQKPEQKRLPNGRFVKKNR